MEWIYKYIDKQILWFLIKFIFLFGLFYGINYGFIGITAPGGLYWEWLDKHLNYVAAFRKFLLSASSVIIGLFGYKSVVSGYFLYVINGAALRMVYSCIGLGILSFWWAFVLAFPQTKHSKVRYFIWGSLLIISMNIIRISALAILYTKYPDKSYKTIDHHFIFEVCVYSVLFFMIYKWVSVPFKENNGKKNKI